MRLSAHTAAQLRLRWYAARLSLYRPAISRESKIAAGLLGLFLGAWGVHNFYLGNTNRGILQIVLTVVTCGLASLWGFMLGIMILSGSIKTDAKGVPLSD